MLISILNKPTFRATIEETAPLVKRLNAEEEDGWSYRTRLVCGKGFVIAVYDETGREVGEL